MRKQISTVLKNCRKIMRKDKGLSGELDRIPMLTWLMLLKFLDDRESIDEAEAVLAGNRFTPIIRAPYRWRDWAEPEDGLTGDALISFLSAQEFRFPDGSVGPGLFHYLRNLSGEDETDRREVVATVFSGVTNRMLNGYLLRDVLTQINGLHFEVSGEVEILGHMYESLLREMRDSAGDSGEFYTPRPVVRFMVEATEPTLGEVVYDPACGTGGFLVEAHRVLNEQVRSAEDVDQLAQSIRGTEAKPLPYLLGQMNLILHGIDNPHIDQRNSLGRRLSELGERDRVDVILTNPPFGGEEERGILSNFPSDRQTTETAALFLQLILRLLRRPRAGSEGGRCAVVVSDGFLSTKGVLARIKQDLVDTADLHTIVRLPKGVFAPYTPIKTNLLFFQFGRATEETWYYEIPPPEGRQMYTMTKPLPYEPLETILSDWWQDRRPSERSWRVGIREIAEREFDLDIPNPHRPVDADQSTPIEIAEMAMDAAGVLPGYVSQVHDRVKELPVLDEAHGVPVGEAITQRKEFVTIDDETEYQLITVQLHGRGIRKRERKFGQEIKMKKQQVLRPNDLVVAEIDAKVGGFGLVPAELSGSIVSSHYFVYEIDEEKIDLRYLDWFLRSGLPEEAIQPYVKGSTNYASVRQHHFPLLELRLPSLPWQQDFLEAFDKLEQVRMEAQEKADALQSELRELVPSLLRVTYSPD